MLDNVEGNVVNHLVVGATASLLCVLLIMGLKLKWFRAKMNFDQPAAQQEVPYVGVYRSTLSSDFDSFDFPSTSSFPPVLTSSSPAPHPGKMTSQPTPGSSTPYTMQANLKEEKPKKTKEEKPKVPKVKEVKTKPPKEVKSKAPKLPKELKSEEQKTTGIKSKETKTKLTKVKAPKKPNEDMTNVSKTDGKSKETKAKNKLKSKDKAGEQLTNGAVKNGNNIFAQADNEIASANNNAFLFIRPKSMQSPQLQSQEEDDDNAVLRYDSFGGENRTMKTFGSMMPTKGQVDFSVSPIPQHKTGSPRVLRNPIASGLESYKPPRDRMGVSHSAGNREVSGSVYVNMSSQPIKADQQFFMNLEDESET